MITRCVVMLMDYAGDIWVVDLDLPENSMEDSTIAPPILRTLIDTHTVGELCKLATLFQDEAGKGP